MATHRYQRRGGRSTLRLDNHQFRMNLIAQNGQSVHKMADFVQLILLYAQKVVPLQRFFKKGFRIHIINK
jgi:hypothetical protein